MQTEQKCVLSEVTHTGGYQEYVLLVICIFTARVGSERREFIVTEGEGMNTF